MAATCNRIAKRILLMSIALGLSDNNRKRHPAVKLTNQFISIVAVYIGVSHFRDRRANSFSPLSVNIAAESASLARRECKSVAQPGMAALTYITSRDAGRAMFVAHDLRSIGGEHFIQSIRTRIQTKNVTTRIAQVDRSAVRQLNFV